MGKICAAVNCTNKKSTGDGQTFHPFPIHDGGLCQLWIAAIGRRSFLPTKNHFLCQLHFLASDYTTSEISGKRKRVLKKDAVPSIFNDFRSPLTSEESRITTQKPVVKSKIPAIPSHHSGGKRQSAQKPSPVLSYPIKSDFKNPKGNQYGSSLPRAIRY